MKEQDKDLSKLGADAIIPAMPGHVMQAFTLLKSSPEAQVCIILLYCCFNQSPSAVIMIISISELGYLILFVFIYFLWTNIYIRKTLCTIVAEDVLCLETWKSSISFWFVYLLLSCALFIFSIFACFSDYIVYTPCWGFVVQTSHMSMALHHCIIFVLVDCSPWMQLLIQLDSFWWLMFH